MLLRLKNYRNDQGDIQVTQVRGDGTQAARHDQSELMMKENLSFPSPCPKEFSG